MRLILFILILSANVTGCSSTSPGLNFSLESLSFNATQNKQFKELDSILATDVKLRDLAKAKQLVLELKKSVFSNHPRYTELTTIEQWINESLDYQAMIKSLEQQTQLLKSKAASQKKALEHVRRTLVTE